MKYNRQSEIIALITENEIETQEDLSARLQDKGYAVTQATISRDIRELKLVKVAADCRLTLIGFLRKIFHRRVAGRGDYFIQLVLTL